MKWIMLATAPWPHRRSGRWMWASIFPYHEGRTPTHGYEATREAAMTAFAKRWRRE